MVSSHAENSPLIAKRLDSARIFDRSRNFKTVVDDPGIGEQSCYILGAKSSHAIDVKIGMARKAARLLSIVSQDSPAWLISSCNLSNRTRSSVSGKPYSRSW